jgi:hypothetical protein
MYFKTSLNLGSFEMINEKIASIENSIHLEFADLAKSIYQKYGVVVEEVYINWVFTQALGLPKQATLESIKLVSSCIHHH